MNESIFKQILHIKNVVTIAISLVCLTGCNGQTELTIICDTDRMYKMIQTLASDSLAGRRAESGNDLKAAQYIANKLSDDSIKALWDELIMPFEMGDVCKKNGMCRILDGSWTRKSYNVVATIESDHPNEDKVLLGAHYDHIGLFKADKGKMWKAGDLLLGANDNASGTVAVIEIARLLKPYAKSFKRDLIVALFGAEEMGIVGSTILERTFRNEGIEIGHMVNLDMIGKMRGDTLMLQGINLSPIGNIAKRTPCPNPLIVYMPKLFSSGSDYRAFADKNIPISHFTTTDISTMHLPNDIPESLNMKGMELTVNYIANYVYQLLTITKLPQAQ